MNKEFTITFWVSLDKNPSWVDTNSEINFPPFSTNNWIQVFFSKIWKELKIYILHPELWYRKIKANIEKYLTEKTFIALTNDENETKLYLNANLVTIVSKQDLKTNLEVWDYVMVQIKNWDLEKLKIDWEIEVIVQAIIKKIKWDSLTLDFFTYWEIKILSKDKLIY